MPPVEEALEPLKVFVKKCWVQQSEQCPRVPVQLAFILIKKLVRLPFLGLGF